MKTTMALVVTLGLLFVAVPSATPKGVKPGPSGVNLTVGCSEPTADAGIDTDTCIITASGMTNGTYKLFVTNSCGESLASNESANFRVTIYPSDCTPGLTIQLFSVGRGGALTSMTLTITDNTGGVV